MGHDGTLSAEGRAQLGVQDGPVRLPALDDALRELGKQSPARGDTLTQFLVEAQLADSQRRERWTEALMTFLESEPENKAYLSELVEHWSPLADQALQAYRGGFAN